MIRKILRALAITVVLCISAPVYADSVLHIWSCQLEDGKTNADALAASSVWLKAARAMPGGKDVIVSLDFPLAANTGDGSFAFVLMLADAKTWGLFMNDYEGSAAAEADAVWGEVASCSRSEIWASVDVE